MVYEMFEKIRIYAQLYPEKVAAVTKEELERTVFVQTEMGNQEDGE